MTSIEYGVEVPTDNGRGVIACISEADATAKMKLFTDAKLVIRLAGNWSPFSTLSMFLNERLQAMTICSSPDDRFRSDAVIRDIEVRVGDSLVWIVEPHVRDLPVGIPLSLDMADQTALAIAQAAEVIRLRQKNRDKVDG